MFRVPFDHGLHLRPAALVADALRPFACDVAIGARGRRANARSTVALMALGIQRDETVEVVAVGADAAAAIAALGQLLAPVTRPTETKAAVVEHVGAPPESGDPRRLDAVVASRGLAVGVAAQFARSEIAVAATGGAAAAESSALREALVAVKARLQALADAHPGEQHAVLTAHVALIQDPELAQHAQGQIHAGKSAGYAWRHAVRATADALRALGDPRMTERIADLNDLEDQVLRALAGLPPDDALALPDRAILLAEDLLPSQLIALERGRIAGICTALGGPTAHVAIIAAALGIPMLVAAGPRVLGVRDGTTLVLDAERGQLQIDPAADERVEAEQRVRARAGQRAEDLAHAGAPSVTTDQTRIVVHANLGALSEAQAAVAQGAEGCGLLRTEFLFIDRQDPPDEREQALAYQQIATALDGRPLTIRTMDIGGDKSVPFLPLPREENPALGLRGLRGSLWQPELLKAQLRAILCVQPGAQCRVLLPMVTEVGELVAVRALLAECGERLGLASLPALGAMIETPASALLADQLLLEADFLSIGTNDLAQYVLAMDRAQPALAGKLDALHPAVLRLIAAVATAGSARGRSVGVCGGLGSDPQAIPILIGLGIREVSAVPAMIPQVKRGIRELEVGACRELAESALALTSAAAVRTLVAEWSARRTAAGRAGAGA
jgi:phosphoenolpyruvate-protein phosphotransferase